MNDIGNPRDHLANERTHLAWVRTALTVVVLGLAVARFGAEGGRSTGSFVAGAVMLAAGTSVLVYGSLRYRATAKELVKGDFPTVRSTTGPIVAAGVLLAATVIALAILIITDP